jgi:protoporphyrin/coproporphyrin ferrochelatase
VNSIRTGVVLFNLGGPDSLDSVGRFLFNLFNDPAIIRLPQPFRYLIARLITWRRTPTARLIYEKMGGRSPILEETIKQASSLENELNASKAGRIFKVVVSMRYSKPRSVDARQELKNWNVEEVVLLPLYPQFSTTTTASSLLDWKLKNSNTRTVCCWPTEPGLIESHAGKIASMLKTDPGLRVLFSAHGLPKKIVDAEDPYPDQIEKTARAVVGALEARGFVGIDWRICYQSRVGPLEWIGPSTEEEIHNAGNDGKGVVVVPIAFVSEHSETLVELDIDYRRLASECGVPRYERTPTPGSQPAFIAGLARLVFNALESPHSCVAGLGEIRCENIPACPQISDYRTRG